MEKLKTKIVNPDTICRVCLSLDRTLHPLKEYTDIFSRICNYVLSENVQVLICWECLALLKKAKLFEEKVLVSRKTLNSYDESKKNIIPTSLSTLKILKTEAKDINITYTEDNDVKEVIQNIKEENIENNYDDANNIDNYDNDYLQDDFKEEIPFEFKKEKKDVTIEIIKKSKKSKRYMYVFDKINKNDIDRLTEKIQIQLSEVKYWMERERDSVIYKSAKYKCETCVHSWKTEKAFLEHTSKYHHSSSGPYGCDICKCRFPKKYQMTRHLVRHTSLLECVKCRHRCYKNNMYRHLEEHTRKLKCTACEATNFSSIRQLFKHHKSLHEVFICDHCSKYCKSKSMLEKHMRRHYETYECKICDKRYATRATLRQHCEARHCSNPLELAYCAPCGKQFPSTALYRRHVAASAAHAAERDATRSARKVPCPECGRVYTRKTYMMNHYRHVHTHQSRYYCRQCDKAFLNSTKFVDHMRYQHEGVKREKDKLCNICGRGFAAKKTLENHIRTHSGERPFECSQCGSKFTQKYAMQSHVRHVHLHKKRRTGWRQD